MTNDNTNVNNVCEHCGDSIEYTDRSVPPSSVCSEECADAWDAENPGEWIAVEDMTPDQRAELLAVLRIVPRH